MKTDVQFELFSQKNYVSQNFTTQAELLDVDGCNGKKKLV